MAFLLHDLTHAIRQLRQRPLFTLTAVVTLAIGMGVNAVAFTVVNGLLFRGLARSAAGDVGRIATTPGGDEGGNASLEEYRRFAESARGAADVAAEGRLTVNWRHDGTTETVYALIVSPQYFDMVSVRPIAGRIEVGPASNAPVPVVIGERFWRRKLNAASPAGLTLRLNNTDVAVAGVLPDSYTGPAGLYSPDVWVPLESLTTAPSLLKRDTRWLFVMARLRPGATAAEVQGRVEAAAAAMARDWPETHRQRGARFHLFGAGSGERRGLTIASGIAMGIIGLVLLLACFNVANLLLARAVERERDMGIRSALGARPARLVRLVIAEGFLIAGLAGAAALVLASWTQTLVGSFAIPIEEPQHVELSPDATVIGFIAALVIVAGVLPGLWPALAAARVDVLRVLGSQGANAAGGRPSRMRRWLVGAQIAGSTVFLAIAGLFAQSYGWLSATNFGFDHDHLVVAEFEPASAGYDADRAERAASAFLARARAMPGVTGAALADNVPFFVGFDRMTAVSSGARCEAAAAGCKTFATMTVGPGYFRTMGVALSAGREFAEGGASTDVVVNERLARLMWPDGRGLGETLRIGEGDRAATVTVAGITAPAHTRGLDREQPTLYVPLSRAAFEGRVSLVVRTAGAPGPLVRPLLDAAQALGPDVAPTSVKTMRDRMAVQLWPFRTVSWLFSICGALALVLAASGLAAVVIHAVARRMREFGVRVSIGATSRDLIAEVLRGSTALLLPGLIAGTVLAAVIARLIRAALFGVNPLNPSTYLAVALLECVIVAAASIGPALRAARVDPLIALKGND
jgi:putative ABC transport system permease protein